MLGQILRGGHTSAVALNPLLSVLVGNLKGLLWGGTFWKQKHWVALAPRGTALDLVRKLSCGEKQMQRWAGIAMARHLVVEDLQNVSMGSGGDEDGREEVGQPPRRCV